MALWIVPCSCLLRRWLNQPAWHRAGKGIIRRESAGTLCLRLENATAANVDSRALSAEYRNAHRVRVCRPSSVSPMSTFFTRRNLPSLLLQAREAVLARDVPCLRQHELTDAQWRVLRFLGEQGTVETGRLAREACILGPSLSGVLDRMERNGLVRRKRDPVDGRRIVVQTTTGGARLVAKLSHCFDAHQRHIEQTVGSHNLVTLCDLLVKLMELEQVFKANDTVERR